MKLGLLLLFLGIHGAVAAELCPPEMTRLHCSLMSYAVDSHRTIDIRVGVMSPADGKIKADILYIHGFADRLDNHAPLFNSFNSAGLRVIAFDLPGHGENQGQANSIDDWSFETLAKLVSAVSRFGRGTTPQEREAALGIPLFLSGWSTGGLLADRIVQSPTLEKPARSIVGVILFAPGIAVHPLPGQFGHVTLDSLSHLPADELPHHGLPKPAWPIVHVPFDVSLLANSAIARVEKYPDTPTIVFSGGDGEDVYVNSRLLRNWVWDQNNEGSNIVGVSCTGAKHELDNEIPGIGDAVRDLSAKFIAAVLDGVSTKPEYNQDRCTEYSKPSP
jgi:pimeloyl-ACP methyl ester carboxylesterase